MDDLSKAITESPSAKKNHGGLSRWKPVFLALMVPLGLIAVLWLVFREQLVRAVPVETGRVILIEQETGESTVTQQDSTEMLFQASGWVEPDPWRINLAVKVNGFVEQVFVKEGESVTNGQLIATLDPTDAQLALSAAKNTALATQSRLEAATARLTAKRDIWERYSNTPHSAISYSDRIQAEQDFIEAKAQEQAARAACRAAAAHRDTAALALERTVIRSHTNGIVLRRYAAPGDKRRLSSDDPNSATIVSLYDPQKLQVRVDVPIAEAGKMTVGQPCRISTALLSGRTFTGRVTRIIGQADLQRNTLQAKVKIDAPDARLRPEILCRVEFWSRATENKTTASGRHTLWIPQKALQSDAKEQQVWVIDPLTKTVSKRTVRLAPPVRDGFRQVAEGLRANEAVIVTGHQKLKEGIRIKEASQ